jgi:hypothetical protein
MFFIINPVKLMYISIHFLSCSCSHPDIIQDVLSNKVKEMKTKLTPYQKAVIWKESGLRKAIKAYRSSNPIVLPTDINSLTNNVTELKELVMRLGVRTSDSELSARKANKQLKLSTGPNRYI